MPDPYHRIHQPHRERLLTLLSDLDWHGNAELSAASGARFGARLHELKRLGYSIEDENLDDGQGKRYRLVSLDPGRPQTKRVKVLLREFDAERAAVGDLTEPARMAIQLALSSFRRNKENL